MHNVLSSAFAMHLGVSRPLTATRFTNLPGTPRFSNSCRLSQIGISRAACAEDEHMLASVAACSPARMLPIVDCRPRSTATANFAAGWLGLRPLTFMDTPKDYCWLGFGCVLSWQYAALADECHAMPRRSRRETASLFLLCVDENFKTTSATWLLLNMFCFALST